MGEQAIQIEPTGDPDVTVAELAPAIPAEAAPTPRQRLPRRAELAQLLDAKLSEDGETREPPRAPDAWLERRLRTFERQMSAMETRQEQVEKNARASAAAAEETIRTMQATVDELTARAEAAEAKTRAAMAELRGALNETTLRVQTVESVAHAALAENHEAPPAEPDAPAEPAPVVIPAHELSEPAETGDAEPAAPPADDAPKSYLSEVRKSVAAATAAAAAAGAGETERKAAQRVRNITRYFLGSVVVLTIFAAGAGVAFSKGVSDGQRDALSRPARHAAAPLAAHLAVSAGTPLDKLTARARSGDPSAELAVGLRYLDGKQKDPAAALHWITLAAVHGAPVAQYRLGLLYASGTPADGSRALQWFEAAALQGNRKAMHDLAIAYAQGRGTDKNPAEAARWFSRAAGFGYVDSEFNLAVLYERGEGETQSLPDAYKWYAVASAQGDAESKARLEALRTQLSADDVSVAEHAARAFKAVPYDAHANLL